MDKVKMIAPFFLCALMTYACGYRFAGSGELPDNIESIFIEVFKNSTSKAGIERVVTNQLIFEFTRQREKVLANDATNADATLKGVIKKIRTKTISRVGTEGGQPAGSYYDNRFEIDQSEWRCHLDSESALRSPGL